MPFLDSTRRLFPKTPNLCRSQSTQLLHLLHPLNGRCAPPHRPQPLSSGSEFSTVSQSEKGTGPGSGMGSSHPMSSTTGLCVDAVSISATSATCQRPGPLSCCTAGPSAAVLFILPVGTQSTSHSPPSHYVPVSLLPGFMRRDHGKDVLSMQCN